MSVWYAASLVLLAPPLAEVTAREATPAVTVSAAELRVYPKSRFRRPLDSETRVGADVR